MVDTIVTNPEMILPSNRVNKMWGKPDIFVPGGAGGRYVPNVYDSVYEFTNDMFILYQVTDADETTGRSTLEVRYALPRSDTSDGRDIILSSAPGRPSDAYRAYVDNSVVPSTINVDTRMLFVGSMARYVKIFKGTDISESGEVVSVMYDQSNTLLGENIPLEEVATAKLPNANIEQGMSTSVKVVSTGYLTEQLLDNELLTVVAYNDAGGLIVTEQIKVVNSSFARQPDAFRKFVTAISIDSPYLSEGDQKLIVFPANLPTDSVFANGVVTYSDGSKKILPIDGTKFRLYGLDERKVSLQRADLQFDLVLTYIPDEEEFYYGRSIGQYRHFSEKYKAKTTVAEAPYSFKIFGYPQWISPLAGYRMRYFFTTLERNEIYEITDHVRLGMNSPAFEPLTYGTAQRLILTVDLSLVSNFYAAGTRIVQPIVVVLRNDGTSALDCWNVANDPDGSYYGTAIKVIGDYVQSDITLLNIKCNAGSTADWLNKLFYAAGPLRNAEIETIVPEPTHFNLVVSDYKSEHPIAAYNTDIQVPFLPDAGTLITFEWIRRTGNGDLLLGVTSAAFYQAD